MANSKGLTHESQCRKILNHLLSGHSISSLYASCNLHITSLHRRLTDIERKHNIEIQKEWYGEGQGKYYRYFLTAQQIAEFKTKNYEYVQPT